MMKMNLTMKLVFGLLTVALLAGCQGATTSTPGNGDSSTYKVVIKVTAQAETWVNAYVYDGNGSRVATATISVDGANLPVMTDSSIHWANLGTTWAEGSTHTYAVTTADGKKVSGTMVKPVGTVAGVTYSPAKNLAFANEYVVTPPATGWPADTYLKAMVVSGGSTYGVDTYPVGASPATVTTAFPSKTSVTFSTCLLSTATIPGYATGSKITVAGTDTPW